MLCVPFIVSKIGKRNAVILGNLIALVGYFIIWPLSGDSIPLLIAGNMIAPLGLGFGMSLIFIMISDTVDYGEWKSGVRAEGLLSAAASFGQKVGTGFGGALAGWILALCGYNGDAAIQTASAMGAITFNYGIVPIIASILTIVLMMGYRLDKEMPQMLKDLGDKRQKVNN